MSRPTCLTTLSHCIQREPGTYPEPLCSASICATFTANACSEIALLSCMCAAKAIAAVTVTCYCTLRQRHISDKDSPQNYLLLGGGPQAAQQLEHPAPHMAQAKATRHPQYLAPHVAQAQVVLPRRRLAVSRYLYLLAVSWYRHVLVVRVAPSRSPAWQCTMRLTPCSLGQRKWQLRYGTVPGSRSI